jgi:hypothetical protein
MKNVSLDRATVLQLYTHGTDGALNAAADCDILSNHTAIDRCAFADQEVGSAQLAFNSAEDLSWTITFDLTNDRHAGADAGVWSRFGAVGSGLGATCSTAVLVGCTVLPMSSSAFAALFLSGSGLVLKLLNMLTSPCGLMSMNARVTDLVGFRSSTNATISVGRQQFEIGFLGPTGGPRARVAHRDTGPMPVMISRSGRLRVRDSGVSH